MPGGYTPGDRDGAARRVWYWTGAAVAGGAALTGVISAASAAAFAAATPAAHPVAVPVIPVEPAPQQSARPTPQVIVQIIHVPGTTTSAGAPAARIAPPRSAPAPAASGGATAPAPPPPPPPPPACVSTPSHPC